MWCSSAANRITGVALSGTIYAYFGAHGLGFSGLDTPSLAATSASLPGPARLKVSVALLFAYHS